MDACKPSLSVGIPNFRKTTKRRDFIEAKPFRIPEGYDPDNLTKGIGLQSKYKRK
jgi:hypothetical protein